RSPISLSRLRFTRGAKEVVYARKGGHDAREPGEEERVDADEFVARVLVQISKHKWDLGIARYEEVRDSGNSFFFEQLPACEYTFKYRLRAAVAVAVSVRVGPATAQSMYARSSPLTRPGRCWRWRRPTSPPRAVVEGT
ncbi:MAG: hypothetical protein LJF30_02275, partial [Acidobacteria bacterium]|nr:hypothetical protein [Acidobacteriota bacterium]